MAAIEGAYNFYQDSYGGELSAEAFASALPAALRLMRHMTRIAPAYVEELDSVDLLDYMHGLCAAADAFAEFGEGRVGGFKIGDFKLTNYMEKGTTGWEVAMQAVAAELSGLGLLFSGVA